MGNIENIVWGGYYRNKHSRWNNDQSYGTSVPVKGPEGEVWMVDTYELVPKYKTSKALEYICNELPDGEHLSGAKSNVYNFYHNNMMEVKSDQELEANFEFIADLNEYRAFETNELASHYAKDDILCGVRLYKEHGYEWDRGPVGVYLVKKDATKDSDLIFKEKLGKAWSSFTRPSGPYSYDIERAKEALHILGKENADPRDLAKLKQLEYFEELVDEFNKQINEYIESTKYVQNWSYLKEANLTLGDIFGVDYYLKNKCYCPNEVYNLGGFFYELFYPDEPIKLLANGDRGYVVICKCGTSDIPEMLLVTKNEESNKEEDAIVDITRYDVTKNNIEIAIAAVKEDTGSQKVDKLDSRTRLNEIDELIESYPAIDLKSK